MSEITVAITTYNLEKYLNTCVDELMRQSYQDFHILVYDDCSSDGTRGILSRLSECYPQKITVLYGCVPLRTPAASRNAILDSGLATGKYIIFLDGDDSIEPMFLEKLHETIQRWNADIAICAYDRFETESGHILCTEMTGFPESMELPISTDDLAFINTSLWNKLIRMDRIGSIRIPSIKVGEDLCFLHKVLCDCDTIAFTNEVLMHYRVHAASVISNVQQIWVFDLAGELARLRSEHQDSWMQPTLELISFIHIGIAMPLRAYQNPAIDRKKLNKWITGELSPWYLNARFLHLHSLSGHGIKGLGIWFVKLCYKMGCFGLFRTLFVFMTQVLHIDIKF